MKTAAPKTIRETLTQFLSYDPEVGLYSSLSKIEWNGVLPNQIYYSVLDRHPETMAVCLAGPEYSAHEHFCAALNSDEFQEAVTRLLLKAFPELRRLIYIHIPKCAGADLIGALSTRIPFVSPGLADQNWTDKATLFAAIKAFVINALTSEQILFGGHITLIHAVSEGVYRFGDDVFTVVRDPVDRILSAVNYMVGVIQKDRDVQRPDTREWIRSMGLKDLPRRLSKARETDLAHMILGNRDIIMPNEICEFLGGDSESAATDLIVRCNIEITDTARYESWLRTRWNIPSSARLNASKPILRREDLSSSELDYVHDISSEDRRLYGRIRALLNQSSTPSIRGIALAQ